MARNINPNLERSLSQKERILQFLQSGGSLTSLEALQRFGSARLASRISDLIVNDGHTEIQKEYIWVETAGGKARVVRYFIDPELSLAI